MDSSVHRELRLYRAVLSLATVAALGAAPLVAQVSRVAKTTSCLEAKLIPVATLGQAGDNNLIASALPSLTNFFFIGVETETLTGRLICADPRPAFYNCGHTKQSVWGCKPDCFVQPDGSQYVLESPGRSYSVTGDANQIRPFLTDEVTVTGKLTGETIKAVSITKFKASTKARLSSMRSE